MRILQLCHKPPFPATDGGSIAMLNLARGLLHHGSEVHVLAMNTYKQRCEPEQAKAMLGELESYDLVEADIRIRPVSAFANLFGTKSYNISRFQSRAFEEKLSQLLAHYKFDLIILESLFSTTCLPLIESTSFDGLVVLRSHNVEFNIWENLARNESNFLKKHYLRFLSRRLKRYELKTWQAVDQIASISAVDEQIMKSHGCTTSIINLPFGVDMAQFESQVLPISSPPVVKLYHVGSMNWLPHQEAFRWFFQEVWDTVSACYPEVELHLAGTAMPDWLLALESRQVKVSPGYVDGRAYAQGKEIMIVPSFSGSGIRVKIVEAMALGKAIVTTGNGAMGIDCTDQENIFISDDPVVWVKNISRLIEHKEERARISAQAKQFCKQTHDYRNVAEILLTQLKTSNKV